jgi:hypothetical protein
MSDHWTARFIWSGVLSAIGIPIWTYNSWNIQSALPGFGPFPHNQGARALLGAFWIQTKKRRRIKKRQNPPNFELKFKCEQTAILTV